MNLKIAIVEDDETQLIYVKELMKQWFAGTQNSLKLVTCESAEEFLFKYIEVMDFDLILLDIKLRKMNGMELAKQIRKKDKTVQIAFLTGVKDYVFEGYEIGAIRYLLKPVQEKDLYKLLDDCLAKSLHIANEYFIFPYMGESVRLSYNAIIYIQVEGHYLQMITIDKTYEWKGSLSSTLDILDKHRFILANRSTIINLEHVIKITREQCCFEDGQTVSISRGYYNALNEAFISYYLGNCETSKLV
jgi:DNA-binding LytR/AlgR family response regulator